MARDEFSYREIHKTAQAKDFVINYSYNDHSDADKDINCLFPIERFRELEQEGYIGKLSSVNFTMGMGRLYKRTYLQMEVVPEIVGKLRKDKVDALFLVPS
jgi:D-proline reductase (dithiol) PrdB